MATTHKRKSKLLDAASTLQFLSVRFQVQKHEVSLIDVPWMPSNRLGVSSRNLEIRIDDLSIDFG